MSVPPVEVVGEDRQLQHERVDERFAAGRKNKQKTTRQSEGLPGSSPEDHPIMAEKKKHPSGARLYTTGKVSPPMAALMLKKQPGRLQYPHYHRRGRRTRIPVALKEYEGLAGISRIAENGGSPPHKVLEEEYVGQGNGNGRLFEDVLRV